MTDTGRLPEGQPENASGPEASVVPDVPNGFQAGLRAGGPGGVQGGVSGGASGGVSGGVQGGHQAGFQAPADFGFTDTGEAVGEEDDLLFLPGPQGAWSETPAAGTPTAPAAVSPPAAPRRPLHMGPPVPGQAGGVGVVRSLADRGPATPPAAMPSPVAAAPVSPVVPFTPAPVQAPVAETPGYAVAGVEPVAAADPAPAEVPAPVADVPPPADLGAVTADPVQDTPPPPSVGHAQPMPVRVPGPPTSGPEYLDVPHPGADLPGPQLGRIPSQPASWTAAPEPAPAPAVVAVQPVEPEAAVPPAQPGSAETVVQEDPAPEQPAAVVTADPEPERPEVADVPQPAVELVADAAAETAAEAVAETPAEPEPETAAVPETAERAEEAELAAAAVAEPAVIAEPEPEPQPESSGPVLPPAAPFDDNARAAVHRVMRERRDIRNGFRSDPVPHEVLLRVLEAAHTAPSVGHSQPWDFVVIRSEETRRRMHELATRQKDAYAQSLPKGRAKQFKELKVEAILDTPVNIVVTADPTRGGRHTLGRHTQPQMAPYSSALAVENLWLAARAEGLGVGWVSFFDERELCRELDLPEHLDIVAYLCVGYVDEFPEEPELVQSGWSKRRPLSWVVHEETYGRRALPGEDPHDLLLETLDAIRPLDAKALGEAWERQKRMTKPAGSLGMLEIISAQLCGLSRKCPPPVPEPAAVAIFAGDHGVHAQGVTPWPQEVTAQMVANFLGGGAVCNAFAGQVGAEVCVVDVGVAADLPNTPGLVPRKVRAGTADFSVGPAMSREDALRAIEVGIETARDLVTAGNKALLTGEMGIANTTASAALISVFTDADPADVTGRGTGINDETHARKVEVVRRALELHRPDASDPVGVLEAVGGFEHAALVGFILGGASLRTPVILDGVSAGAAALVARAIAPEALAACVAGHRSAEPGHSAALTKLGLRPLIDLDLRLGEGTGALLALPLVQSAARAMHEVATFDAAGVTEKG